MKALLGTATFSEAAIEEVHRAYNVKNHVVVKLPGVEGQQNSLLLSEEGQVDATGARFVDSVTQIVYRIQHRTGLAQIDSSVAIASLPHFLPSQEQYRAPLASSLRSHVQNYYNAMSTGSHPWAKGAETYSTADGHIVMLTSALVRNLSNFWSGAWIGRYSLQFPEGAAAGVAILEGSIRIRTHYFENGNTQMHGNKAIPATEVRFTAHDGASLARAVIAAVAAAEDGLCDALDEMYESMSQQALKEMRRFLPVSGQKMNWNALQHRLNRSMQNTPSGQA